MKYPLLFLLFSVSVYMHAQSPVVKAEELKPWLGKWSGTFWIESTSVNDKPILNVEVTLGPVIDGNKIPFSEIYPGAPAKNLNDTLRISADGKVMNYMDLSSKQKSAGALMLVFTTEGEDDNQKAEIRVTYGFIKDRLLITREVRHRGRKDFIPRSGYTLIGDNSP